MRLWSAVLLVCVLLGGCVRSAAPKPPRAAQTTATETVATEIAAPVSPPSTPPRTPVPAQAQVEFPTCEPDPVSPFNPQAWPLVTPAAPAVGVEAAPALRPLLDKRGMYAGVSTAPQLLNQPGYTDLLLRHFNIIATEVALKWEVVHPEAQRYDFSQGDALVAFARLNHMDVYAQALVWDLQQPVWLTGLENQQPPLPRDEWIQILCRHVKTVVGRYRGQINAWIVVNEPFQNSGALRDTLWMRTIGPEHIAMVFQWARQADPTARLILNEHFAEGLNAKSEAIYALAQGLLQQGIPIDGVGLQMHVWLWGPPSPAELRLNMRRLAELGLMAHITEMDVRTQYTRDSRTLELEAQAQHYRQAFAACLEAPNCDTFVAWGLTDRYSWIPDYTGYDDAPLLFDYDGLPKPAFDAIYELLSAAP